MSSTETLSRSGTVTASPFAQVDRALSRALGGILNTVQLWQRRRYDRAVLRNLPDYLLRDVGLDVADARFEADKPFWRR